MKKPDTSGFGFTNAAVYTVFAALGLIAVLMALKSTSAYGAGMSPDAVSYISTAEHLLEGKGYLDYDGLPYLMWPPLFPTVLALLGLTGMEPHTAARFLNAVCFGLIVFCSGLLFSLRIRSRSLVILGAVAILLSFILLQLSAYAFSEPLFIVLLILFMFNISKFLETRQLKPLIFAALCAALATLQRYVGLTTIIAGVFSILLFTRKSVLLERLKYSLIFGAAACTPNAVWFIHNKLAAGSTTARHFYLKATVDWLVLRPLNGITPWFVTAKFPLATRLVIIGIFAGLLVTAVILRRLKFGKELAGNTSLPKACAVLILIYAFFTLSAAAFAGADANERLWASLYVFLILFILIGLEAFGRLLGLVLKKDWAAYLVVIVLCSLWLIFYSLPVVKQKINQFQKFGAPGINSAFWHQSPLIQWLKTHPLQGQVFSNEPATVYFWTGRYVRLSPHRRGGVSRLIISLDQFKQLISKEKNNYIIWSFKEPRPDLYNLKELNSMFKLKLLAQLQDGVVVKIE